MKKMNGWLKNEKIYSLASGIKEKGKKIIAGFLVGVMFLLAPLTFAGCRNTPPENTDSGIVSTDTSTGTEKPGTSDTDTEKPGTSDTDTENPGSTDTENPGTQNPGTENPGGTDTDIDNPGSTDTDNPGTENPGTENPGTDNPNPDVPNPGIPPVEDDITLEEFLADNGGITATNFANDIIDDMTNYQDMKAVAYSFEASEGKITSINVAYVVACEGTVRQLKQAEINLVGGVEMQDIIDGTVSDFTTTTETTGTLLTFDAKEEANKGDNSTIQTQIQEAITNALGEEAQIVKPYQMEQFSATVADWAEANKEQINTILSNKCLDKIVNDCYFGMYTKDQIQNARWVLEGETEATGAKLVCEVNYGSGAQVQVIDINFTTPVKLDKIDNLSNVQIANVSVDYNFGYNHAAQSRTELTDALFKAVGVNEIGGQRYFKDNGQTAAISGLGMANGFTIVEVREDQIQEYKIYVNVASSDTAYISKLANSSEFKITNSQVVDISGASVEYVAQVAKTLSAKTGTKRMIITTADGKQFMV